MAGLVERDGFSEGIRVRYENLQIACLEITNFDVPFLYAVSARNAIGLNSFFLEFGDYQIDGVDEKTPYNHFIMTGDKLLNLLKRLFGFGSNVDSINQLYFAFFVSSLIREFAV